MNNQAHRMDGLDSRRVLMLDYLTSSAEIVGYGGADRCDHWDANAAFRHADTCNVLFYDGHVDSVMRDRIDPCDEEPIAMGGGGGSCCGDDTDPTYREYWEPRRGSGDPGVERCYDPESGFPELWDMWIVTETGCSSTFYAAHPLDPNGNVHVVLAEESATQYRLVFSDQPLGSGQVGNDMELLVFRSGSGDVEIAAMWHTSAGIYTIYDGNPNGGGRPIPGLIRLGGNGTSSPQSMFAASSNLPWNTSAHYGSCPQVIENIVPGARAVIPRQPCNIP